MNRTRVAIALGLLYVIWGSTYFGIRIALRGLPPLFISGARYLAAGALLYTFLRARGVARPTLRQWGGAALIGALLVFGNGCVALAEQWVSSSMAAIAISSVPLWIALFAGLFGTWPTGNESFGLGVGLCGVLILQTGSDLRASPAGALVLLVSCLCWGLGSTWGRKLPLPRAAMSSAAQMLAGGVFVLLLSLLRGERPWQAHVPAECWIALAYLAIFGSLIAYSAYQYLLTHVRPALASSYAYVNPLVAVFLGAAFAGETVSSRALAALALILGGVGLLALARTPAVTAAARSGE
jgi:drug/metabolite transporter (DMT)-like permease